MSTGISNASLSAARRAKKDEFYTQLQDIEAELRHYKAHFQGKVVYCNCDDPNESNFVAYFKLNFEHLGLKKLIATHYQYADMLTQANAYKLEYTGSDTPMPDEGNVGVTELKGDGDFRSDECIDLLRQADIVVTNPPFSLFREYVAQLVKYDKRFLIIGNMNAITYKETFPLVKNNQMWLGPSIHSGDREFRVPASYPLNAAGVRLGDRGERYLRIKGVRWFTNLDHDRRHEPLTLYKRYTSEEYPAYDNYDAINVDKTADIPEDYDGAMGVPITFLDKYCPEQFEILGITDRDNNSGLKTKEYSAAEVPNAGDLNRRGAIKVGEVYKSTYARLLIRGIYGDQTSRHHGP